MLTRKQTPLSIDDVRHLLCRTGFGADIAQIDAFSGSMPEDIVDYLIQRALDLPTRPPPLWIDEPWPEYQPGSNARQQFLQNNAQWINSTLYDWVADMASSGLRERLVLFWHNHFVTSVQNYRFAALAWRYLDTLRSRAFGNFRSLVRDIGVDGAMLRYLNGDRSTYQAPNENYARELLELFTMGPEDRYGAPNYTENDIRELARALTGWSVDYETWSTHLIGENHDTETKTIFGVQGDFDYDGVIDLIFEERGEQIAWHIARAFIHDFVHPAIEGQPIDDLAAEFLDSGYSISSLLRALLTSEIFYHPSTMGARVKSPAELTVGPFVERRELMDDETAIYATRAIFRAEQRLLYPPNVAGWPGHHDWLTTNTLPVRWLTSEAVWERYADPDALVWMARQAVDENDPYHALRLPVALAERLLAVPLDWVEVPSVDEPFSGNLGAAPLPNWFLNGPAAHIDLVKMFLDGLPWYEWHTSRDGAAARISQYIRQLTSWPEYQLI